MKTILLFLIVSFYTLDLPAQSAGSLLGMQKNGDIVTLHTAKATQVLHPLVLPVAIQDTGSGFQLDLYARYKKMFFTPKVVSQGAPASMPHYSQDELFYYITHFDPNWVSNLNIDQAGRLTYDVIAVPPNHQAVFEVVMVIKEEAYPKSGIQKAVEGKSLRFNRAPALKFPTPCAFPKHLY